VTRMVLDMALDSLSGAIEAVIELHATKIGAVAKLLQRRGRP